MAKKRKQVVGAGGPSRPQKKHQQSLKEKQNKEEENKIQEAVQEEEKEEVENFKEEDNRENEDEDEKDVEDDEEEDVETDEENKEEDQNLANQVSSSSVEVPKQDENEEDDEPIEKLLEPLSKEQLLNLLKEAANMHHDIANRIRNIADQDPAHRKIFVYGLGWETTAETLINAFRIYGEIEDCKAVSDKVSGKSKGYGFILFKKRSGARKALEQPQKKIGNRMAGCQLAFLGPVPSSGVASPAFPAQPVSEHTQRKIYVSNVGAELDPQKLTAFFAKFGEIEEGPLGIDKITGKPKGFCLFVYKTIESAKKALEEPHKNFEGHILHCQKAIDGLKPGKTQKQQQQPRSNLQNSHFQQRNTGGSAAVPGHLMAPAVGPGVGLTQGAAAATALNPALGFGLTNFLGNLGSVAGINQGGVPAAFGNQGNTNQGMMGTYGNQGAMQAGYPNQQIGQGGTGGQHRVGQYGGGAPYMGL